MKFSVSWAKLENWLSVAGSAFVGAGIGYVQADLTQAITGAMPWKQIVIGAVAAGAIAVAHLAQVPGAPTTTTNIS